MPNALARYIWPRKCACVLDETERERAQIRLKWTSLLVIDDSDTYTHTTHVGGILCTVFCYYYYYYYLYPRENCFFLFYPDRLVRRRQNDKREHKRTRESHWRRKYNNGTNIQCTKTHHIDTISTAVCAATKRERQHQKEIDLYVSLFLLCNVFFLFALSVLTFRSLSFSPLLSLSRAPSRSLSLSYYSVSS